MGLTVGLGPASVGSSGGVNSLFDLPFVSPRDVMFTITDKTITEFPVCKFGVVTNISSTFENCYYLTAMPQLDFSNVKRADSAFYNCKSLKTMPVLNLENCVSASKMFYGCNNLESIEGLNLEACTDVNYMFNECSKLKKLPTLNTGEVTNFKNMFANCKALESVQLDMGKGYNIENFFYGCSSLRSVNLDISNVGQSNGNVFYNCSGLVDCFLTGLKVYLDLHWSPNLSKESVLFIFNNAQVITSSKAITLKKEMFNQLTADEIAIATEKGFSVVSA